MAEFDFLFKGACGYSSYFALAASASLVIRLVLSVLKWSEGWPKLNPQDGFWVTFRGFGGRKDDYFQPFLVGFLELLVYPALLAAGVPQYIGAWLGLKVVPQLGSWSTNRESYQRFLIGNGLVLVASYFLRIYFYA
jgi:uncharacterized membrane protein YphA (DoxX/SURF4 family)